MRPPVDLGCWWCDELRYRVRGDWNSQLAARLGHAVDHFLTQLWTLFDDVQGDLLGTSLGAVARNAGARVQHAKHVYLAKQLNAVGRDENSLVLSLHGLPLFRNGGGSVQRRNAAPALVVLLDVRQGLEALQGA